MDRRAYLTALGAAAAAVSGCSEGDSTGTANSPATANDTATPTGTERSATATEQPPATATEESATPTSDPEPNAVDSGLLLEPGSFTSFAGIDSIGKGGPLVVGTVVELPVSDGSARGLVEARVLDSQGTELTRTSQDIDTVAETDSEFQRERVWFAFGSALWELGDHTVEFLVNSEDYGTTTATEVPFEVVEPLGPDEASLRLVEFPRNVTADESFDWVLGVRNLTDRDTSLVTDTVTAVRARDDPVEVDQRFRRNIPAGEEIRLDLGSTLDYAGSYTYSLGGIDDEVTFVVDSPE